MEAAFNGKTARVFGASLVMAAVLAGCGGGGGVSDSTAASSTASISGTAVKGPMKNAKISLYRTTTDGKQGTLLTETTSNDFGYYSATVTDYTGIVLVIASVVPGTTTMYDEATGAVITPTAAFTMRASIAAEAGKTYSAQINPFTDLAVANALKMSGGLNATNVAQAKKDMKETLGFNPFLTAPEFDANKVPQNPLAVTLQALSEMAKNGAVAGCTTGEPAEKVACVTTKLSTFGLGDGVDSIKSALQTQVIAAAAAAGVSVPAITEPSGTPVTAASPLELAKDFFAVLRSNAKALDAADLSLQTELQAVSDDMKNRTVPIASSTVEALAMAQDAAQFYNDIIKNTSATFVNSRSFGNGGCSFNSDTNFNVLATTKSEAKYVACGAGVQYLYDPITGQSTQWSTRVRLTPDATVANKFTVNTQTRKSVGSLRTEYGAAFPGNAATLTVQFDSAGFVTGADLTGELSPGFEITGGNSYYDGTNWVYVPPVGNVLGDKHNVTLSGIRTTTTTANGGTLGKLAIAGSIDLIKNGALETRLELGAGSYVQGLEDGTGSYSGQDGSQEMLLKLKANTAGSAVTGDIKLSAFKADASDTYYIPTKLEFVGSVQRDGVSFFDGTLTVDALNQGGSFGSYGRYDASNALSGSNVEVMRAAFGGKVTIPNRPVLGIDLTVTSNDGGVDGSSASLTGQYRQGSITVNLSGQSSPTADVLTLESTDGVKLVLDNSQPVLPQPTIPQPTISQISHPLTFNGTAVGTYTPADGRVTFTDNTYEQF